MDVKEKEEYFRAQVQLMAVGLINELMYVTGGDPEAVHLALTICITRLRAKQEEVLADCDKVIHDSSHIYEFDEDTLDF